MANTQQPTSPARTTPSWLVFLSQRRKETAYVLLGLSAVSALVLALLAYKDHNAYLPIWLWCGALALITLGAGLWQYLREPGQLAETEMTRLVVLAVGGLVGLVTTAVLGLMLAWNWWGTITGGWEAWRGPEGPRIWWTLLAIVGGLAIMFVSLQLARADERDNPLLRRLLYGFNAVLTGLLLLAILVIINLLTYVQWENFGAPWKYLAFIKKDHDWTRASLYSLTDKSEGILKKLDRPVKIYVVLSTQDPLYRPVHALMDNCRAVTDQIDVEYVSPANIRRARELDEQYKFPDKGIQVVVGAGSRTENHFIKYRDLIESSSMGAQRESIFNGEIALMSVLNHLVNEGESKPVLYFTQGNGELDIFDSQDPDEAGLLRQRLESRGFYQVKGLILLPADKAKPEPPPPTHVVSDRVPDDAAVVVILGSRRRFPDHALQALRDYVGVGEGKDKRKGKLMVFQGPVPDRKTGEFLQSGLEELVAAFNVQMGDNVVLHAPDDRFPPTAIDAQPPPPSRMGLANPIAKAFEGKGIVLEGVRTVQPASASRPIPSRFRTEVVLEAPTDLIVWAESDLRRLNLAYLEGLIRSGEVNKIASKTPLPLAVAVSEDDSAIPRDEAHSSVPRKGQTPRLIVMGNVSCFVNRPEVPGRPYDLFNSCLAWLRDRPTDIGIDPKRSDLYEWNSKANVNRMIVLPGIIALVVILGLGAGVYIVRRR